VQKHNALQQENVMERVRRTVIVLGLFSVIVLFVAGCANCPVHRMLFGSGEAKAAPAAAAPAGTDIAQTQCPVLGGKVDPNVYVDYQGRRVYFCCPMCKDTFLKDPAKYLAKLPDSPSAK
jgi:YHS domain-containing protein